MKTQLYLFIYPSQSTAHPAVAFQTLWVVIDACWRVQCNYMVNIFIYICIQIYGLPTSAFSFSKKCVYFIWGTETQ